MAVQEAVVSALRPGARHGATQRHEVLEVAAVFGNGFSPDDLAAVLDEPVGRILPALRETFDADLIISRAHLALFRDETVRDAVCMPEFPNRFAWRCTGRSARYSSIAGDRRWRPPRT